jgi:hypothetical protein
MNSRYITFLKSLLTCTMLMVLVACQDTIAPRSTISNDTSTTDTPTCTIDQTLDATTKTCINKEIVRPTGAVSFVDDFCICKNSKPVAYGSCSTFCAGKSTAEATLYVNFRVTADISLTSYKNVAGWCTGVIASQAGTPSCSIVAKSSDGDEKAYAVQLNGNSLTASVESLSEDKTYILTLKEVTSGATSDSVQVIRFSVDPSVASLGTLKNAPISQYTCVVKSLSTQTTGAQTDIYSDAAYRLHFYFLPSTPPDPIPDGTSTLVCHDYLNPQYTVADNPLYPRLELIQGVFNLWDKMDPRFFDNNGNTFLDANDLIISKTKNFGATIPAGTNFFAKFSWPGSPTISTSAGNTTATNQSIGYYMAPWIDSTTYKSYCLTSTNYNSSNALFKAMRDVLGVDTEGLYVGQKSAETLTVNGTQTTGLSDYILIRETDLKSVWFYMNNNVPTAPTDNNVANVAVYFYYPLNKTTPFVRSSAQRLFRVRSASELSTSSSTNTTGATSSGTPSSVPPHDRKIGCIPKF